MTKNEIKIYRVAVIERALAYYEVEAEDPRDAAENWQDGELYDRDDETLESEGPSIVRELKPDGKWRKVPLSDWQVTAAPGPADGTPRFEIDQKPEKYPDRVHVRIDGKFDVAIIRTDEGVVVDVYPKDGSETIASTYAFEFEAEAPDSGGADAARAIARFDSFEIEPRTSHWEDGDPQKPDHSACEEREADMWRLYGTRHGQDSVCIGEYATRAIAEDIYAGITSHRYGTASSINHRPRKDFTAPITTHTPEPWGYDEETGRIYYADGNVEPTIATVDLENASPQQAKADGRLIAATPRFLAACRMVVERWETGDLTEAARMCQAAFDEAERA